MTKVFSHCRIASKPVYEKEPLNRQELSAFELDEVMNDWWLE